MEENYGEANAGGDIGKYRDIADAKGTSVMVKMQKPKARNAPIHTRPLWKNHANPAQYDKLTMNKEQMTREKEAMGQSTREFQRKRPLTGAMSASSLDLGMSTYSNSMFSEPNRLTQSSFGRSGMSRTALSNTNCISRPFCGSAHHPVHMPVGELPYAAHIPGYKGYIPGRWLDQSALGKSMSQSHLALGRVQARYSAFPPCQPWQASTC